MPLSSGCVSSTNKGLRSGAGAPSLCRVPTERDHRPLRPPDHFATPCGASLLPLQCGYRYRDSQFLQPVINGHRFCVAFTEATWTTSNDDLNPWSTYAARELYSAYPGLFAEAASTDVASISVVFE